MGFGERDLQLNSERMSRIAALYHVAVASGSAVAVWQRPLGQSPQAVIDLSGAPLMAPVNLLSREPAFIFAPFVAEPAGAAFQLRADLWFDGQTLHVRNANGTQQRAQRAEQVMAALGTTLLYFIAIFIAFSYIAPLIHALQPTGGPGISWTLTVFGLAGAAGTLLGGSAADRFGARRTMQLLLLMLAAMQALLPLSAGHPGWMLVVLVFWGFAGFGLMSPQQARLAQMAPAQAPLLLSLNGSMLYIGTAFGAAIGGLASTAVGFAHLPWVAAPFALAAWALLMAEARLGLASAKIAPTLCTQEDPPQ